MDPYILLLFTLSALVAGQVSGCGYTVKAIDREQTISSPGFPVSYPQRSDCTWTIQANYGSHVFINITDFDIGRGAHLYIYDGPNSILLASYTDMNLSTLQPSTKIFTTRTNLAKVRFTSSYVQDLNDGFSFQFMMDCLDNGKCSSLGASAACADQAIGETFCPKLCGSCPHLISQLIG